jgi:hypothetical protein
MNSIGRRIVMLLIMCAALALIWKFARASRSPARLAEAPLGAKAGRR